ncbi:MAG: DUF4062 domain-containing protein [Colwellia sp.]
MDRKPILMVSSTVYGHEEELEVIYTLLTKFNYEVWMSHKGTTPVFSNNSAFQNCLEAVKKCDLFLGIITPEYGSGLEPGELSITHREMKEAIKLDKPRWFLAHDKVVFARAFLNDLGYRTFEQRKELTLKEKSKTISDLRVIQMYEDATIQSVGEEERQGNWVQKYNSVAAMNLFVHAQFSKYEDMLLRLDEYFKNIAQVKKKLNDQEGS